MMLDTSKARIGHAEIDFIGSSINGAAGHSTVEPKVMEVLRVLVDNAGDVVARDTLIDSVWGAPYGGDERLSRAISLLRKALGDVRGKCCHIETIPKRGYRLIAPLNQGAASENIKQKAAPRSDISIAVLPFADMSPKQDHDYFTDGVCEEIINALTQISELKVTGRTSSFAFKGKNKDLRDIASELNVAYILEGSLRKSGEQIRITAQLIQSSDGFHLWSKTYNGHLSEVFEFQDRISDAIVDELGELLDISKSHQAHKEITRNTDAYALFLRGRQLVHQLNGQTTIPTGIKFLKQSIEIDPDFSLAWAWLALSHFILPEFSRTKAWAEHIQQSRDALKQALRINQNSSIGLLVKAMLYAHDLQFDKAIEMHKHAVALDPNNVETQAGMGLGLMAIGLHDAAKPYLNSVIEQDPLCGIWHTTYGGLLLGLGDFEGAEASFKRAFELGLGAAAFGVSHRMACNGKTDEAIAFMRDNFDGLGPIERAELKSPLVRALFYRACLRGTPIAKKIVGAALMRRFANKSSQPTAASIISLLFLNRTDAFMRNITEKPNPYTGYTIARIWEPTEESRNVRMHKGFPDFAKRAGFVRAWQAHGWPKQVAPQPENQKPISYAQPNNFECAFSILE